MSRYIDAHKIEYIHHRNFGYMAFKSQINHISTADVEEIKHGMWVEYKCPRHDPHGRKVCMCTACEEGWDKEDLMRAGKGCLPKRCPECGAKMDKEKPE